VSLIEIVPIRGVTGPIRGDHVPGFIAGAIRRPAMWTGVESMSIPPSISVGERAPGELPQQSAVRAARCAGVRGLRERGVGGEPAPGARPASAALVTRFTTGPQDLLPVLDLVEERIAEPLVTCIAPSQLYRHMVDEVARAYPSRRAASTYPG
jgi:hypothetical protein